MSKFEIMSSTKVALIGILIIGLVVSCKEDSPEPEPEPVPTAVVEVQPLFNGDELLLDATYTTAEGYLVQFTDIKFYLEDVRNSSNVLSDAMLFDYRARGKELFNGEADASKFNSISGNLGVDSVLNHSDPSSFPSSSWLNIAKSNDMHWDWNPGYIFVKVEGRVDTIPDATELFDHSLVFHCGLDANLQTIQFDNLSWVKTGDVAHRTMLNIDMGTFLQGATQSIDLKSEFTSHSMPGQEALTLKVMQNFKEALTP